MVNIEIKTNEEGQRLDRFLRKYLNRAPLSLIYKLIRKDIKVNGKRCRENTILVKGDIISLYLSKERILSLSRKEKNVRVKKQFTVIYQDDNILLVNKPVGLLTHGDKKEKKNHLTNQVKSWLIQSGDYDPNREKTFSPAPVNRLDRNTSGLVIFGKNAEALRMLNKVMRTGDDIGKYYLAIVKGEISEKIVYKGKIEKNAETNIVCVRKEDSQNDKARSAKTIVYPLIYKKDFSLVRIRLFTGRTHQIRAHLAEDGYPILGDPKYGDRKLNDRLKKWGIYTQLLHASEICFSENSNLPEYLKGRDFEAPLPTHFISAATQIFGEKTLKAKGLL